MGAPDFPRRPLADKFLYVATVPANACQHTKFQLSRSISFGDMKGVPNDCNYATRWCRTGSRFWSRIAPHPVQCLLSALHIHVIPRWKQLSKYCTLTQFATLYSSRQNAELRNAESKMWNRPCGKLPRNGVLFAECGKSLP